MPELPEVESVVRNLQKKLTGKEVENVIIRWRRTIAAPSPAKFVRLIKGSRIRAVRRRAKLVIIDLKHPDGSQGCLLTHLRMSGCLSVGTLENPSKYLRVLFALKGGGCLLFEDVRKFGRMWLVDHETKVTSKLGPEPLNQDYSPAQFCAALSKKKGAIKPLLLNQSFISGIGNIYADECLWLAGVHPLTRADRISAAQGRKLLSSIRLVLRRAIRANGTDFGDGVVREGAYKPKVYGRNGLACGQCGATIERIKIGQRSAHYCRRCQKRLK